MRSRTNTLDRQRVTLRIALLCMTAGVLAACGNAGAPSSGVAASSGTSETGSSPGAAAVTSRVDSSANSSGGGGSAAGASAPDSARAAAVTSPVNGGSRELVNPDANTVVFLYYELAHLPLPIDTWVEEDSRVKYAPAPDKAPHRVSVRAELQSAAASVKNVGALRLTMNANLSDYDPSYGEFTVRALSPSSAVSFDALGQKVQVNFKNGRSAQIWRVPQAEAQGIRDKIGYASNVEMDVLLRIIDVLPGPGGGTIVTEVVEYDLRETQRGVALARVQANRGMP
jgi:hypothetical protein